MNRDRRPASSSERLDASGKGIQRRAAEWLALRQARGFTLTEQADFAEWMARDPRHPAMFAEVESSWQTFDRLAWYPHSIDRAADPDLLAPKSGQLRQLAVWRPIALAAAAIAMGGIFWFGQSLVPDIAAPSSAVPPAEARFMRLPVGSTVELNAGSLVTEHFTMAQRGLRLVRGEAHFSVVQDPTREFIVEADGVESGPAVSRVLSKRSSLRSGLSPNARRMVRLCSADRSPRNRPQSEAAPASPRPGSNLLRTRHRERVVVRRRLDSKRMRRIRPNEPRPA